MKLRTLGTTALLGPQGTIDLEEPRLVALLAILAVSGDAGIEADEVMVLLTPDATSDQARNELDRLLALARHVTGDDALIAHPGGRYALRRGAVSLDVDVSAQSDRECAAFLAGFRLPDSPEFNEWLTAARRRVQPKVAISEAPPAAAASAPNEHKSRRWRSSVAIGLLLVAGAVAAWVQVAASRPVAGFAAGDPVLLADIANETGDTLFDRGILSAASVALQQSGHLRLYSRSRLPGVYQLMQITNRDTALTYELAQEVAERDHVRFVLGLRLFRDAGGYRVTARLADVLLGKEVAENSEPAERESDIIAALGRVLNTVRERLGESRTDLRERRVHLPLVTTASLEALRSFAEGRAAWETGSYPLAAELWRRAVDLDTGFAMALGALGGWHYYHHDRANGERYYAEALRRSERLTEWEKLRLLDGVAGYRGNKDSSVALSKVMATRFPNVATWYNYGTTLLQSQRYADAITAFETALTFDSLHVNSYINLATSAKALSKYGDALRYYLKAAALDSMALYRNNINHELGRTYVFLGRVAEAELVFQMMIASARLQDRALGMRSIGFLALWQGHLGRAIDFFSQATDATVQTNATLSQARNRLLLATALRTAARVPEANAEVTRVLALMPSPLFEPQFLTFLAFNCIRLGRIADADSVLRVIRSRVNTGNAEDRAAASLIAGALHIARSHPDSALPLLNAALSHAPKGYVMALRSELFVALGERDSAKVSLEQLLAQPEFGREGQEELQQAAFALGEVLQSQGDTLGAAAAYRRYLEQWRDAPVALPRLISARGRLAALQR